MSARSTPRCPPAVCVRLVRRSCPSVPALPPRFRLLLAEAARGPGRLERLVEHRGVVAAGVAEAHEILVLRSAGALGAGTVQEHVLHPDDSGRFDRPGLGLVHLVALARSREVAPGARDRRIDLPGSRYRVTVTEEGRLSSLAAVHARMSSCRRPKPRQTRWFRTSPRDCRAHREQAQACCACRPRVCPRRGAPRRYPIS